MYMKNYLFILNLYAFYIYYNDFIYLIRLIKHVTNEHLNIQNKTFKIPIALK